MSGVLPIAFAVYPTLLSGLALAWLDDLALPAMPFIGEDEALASRLFYLHGWLAITLGVLVAGHIAAALRHWLRKDGIFQRMV